jgi:hypothetical protein
MATINGTPGNDNLSSETEGDVILGLDGNDILQAIGDNITLDGGAGDDELSSFGLGSTQIGGAGNDKLKGNDGGVDVFKYSFDFTQGGGETLSFTDFFAEHGGAVVGGEVADGTSQGQFSSLYTQWLESLGLNVLDLGQNSGPDGMPVVEGPDGTFGERESFAWTSGSAKNPVVHERWYSDTWSTGEGHDAVTSGDGFDTIVDFTFGEDKLDFSGITKDQFLASFVVDYTQNVDGVGGVDTVITIAGNDDWSLTLLEVFDHDLLAFSNDSIFS